MIIQKGPYRLALSKRLLGIIQGEVEKAGVECDGGIAVIFRDPDYSMTRGSYHPVEIGIDAKGRITHITDFSYVGSPPYAELVKEIDFDLAQAAFQHMGREFHIDKGRGLFRTWQKNFCDYHGWGVFQVEVTPL
ncbi:MAG: DUF2787 family protein [Magnetococcales bacterium]|nr:DUF2787 family protein [Magnetococcales bacterium]